MDTFCDGATFLHLLKLDELTAVCLQLDLRDLVLIAATCKRIRHGDGGLETVELPTKSPVVTVLRTHAFSRPELVPSKRLAGCSESWVAYLARCARQRRCLEAPPIAAGLQHSLCLDAAGRLLACGEGAPAGHGDENKAVSVLTPVAALAAVRVRSVAAGFSHSLALGWDGRVHSWGQNARGQLGHGDTLIKRAPALVEKLDSVCSIAAAEAHSLAVTHSGAVFRWGERETQDALRPIAVEGFKGVRMRRGSVDSGTFFAIGEAGELFSWGSGEYRTLGHGDEQNQPSPKRVKALRDVRISAVSVTSRHALALGEDGLVYAWGGNQFGELLGNPHVKRELLPKPVEALRGVRIGGIAAAPWRSYAVAGTGEVWAWGVTNEYLPPLGNAEDTDCPLPKPIDSLQGVKVDAMAAAGSYTLALADDGSVYAWGGAYSMDDGEHSLSTSQRDARRTPQRVPAIRVAGQGC
jgi:alpha-tubulin suppressor-like RCC1 family protein